MARRRRHRGRGGRSRRRGSNDTLTLVVIGLFLIFALTVVFSTLPNAAGIIELLKLAVVIVISGGALYACLRLIGVLGPVLQEFKQEENTRRAVDEMLEIVAARGIFSHMDDRQFEFFVGEVYERMGYSVHVTEQSGDGGVDVIAKKGSEVLYIQAKHKKDGSQVGRPDIQKIRGTAIPQNARPVLVTSADFSLQAIENAHLYPSVELINGRALTELARKYRGHRKWTHELWPM